MATFETYPKVKALGSEEIQDLLANPEDEIIVEEKVDGANFRFMIRDDGKVIFGSRSQGLGTEDDEIGGNWRRCCAFLKEKITGNLTDDMRKKWKRYIFYGECMARHSICYDYETTPPYLGFDIFNTETGKFVSHGERNALFDMLGLTVVMHIKTCKAKEITNIDDKFVPRSGYYEGPAEGVMFKNYDKQMFGKYVTEKFKEVNKKVFGQAKKYAANDSERLVAIYCTNPRIDKQIFKLIDQGEKLDMKMMTMLPKMVVEDIFEEHWKEIGWSNTFLFTSLNFSVTYLPNICLS